LGRRPLGAILHSPNEPVELSQWLCHDDSTINIVVVIIIIIIIIMVMYFAYFGVVYDKVSSVGSCCHGLSMQVDCFIKRLTLL